MESGTESTLKTNCDPSIDLARHIGIVDGAICVVAEVFVRHGSKTVGMKKYSDRLYREIVPTHLLKRTRGEIKNRVSDLLKAADRTSERARVRDRFVASLADLHAQTLHTIQLSYGPGRE